MVLELSEMKFLYEHTGWVICATLGLGLILIFFGIKHNQKQYNQCKQAGGVFVAARLPAARHNYVCLRPDAVIEMKEVE